MFLRLLFSISLVFILFYHNLQSQDFYPESGWYHQNSDQYATSIETKLTYTELLKNLTSKPVIVAVLDTGVDPEHEDLDEVMWVNEDEIPGNGIDDDGNGYIDDIHGWNFIGGKDGKSVNFDTYEATRIYARLNYKYENAIPGRLTDDQKKEYDLYLEVRELVKEEREKAESGLAVMQEELDKLESVEHQIFGPIYRVEERMNQDSLKLDQIGQLDSFEDDELFLGIQIIQSILEQIGEINDVSELVRIMEDGFAFDKEMIKTQLEKHQHKLEYHYNPEYDPRSLVGDDYQNLDERFYGNNDIKGPDAFHGTHVAGIIAAERENELGIQGIADNARIMSVRMLPGGHGDERDKDVANAIIYAVDNGAKIINMSFGKGYSPEKKVVDDAVQYAQSKDVLLIHAAGNSSLDNDKIQHFPVRQYEKPKGFLFCKKKEAKNWLEVGALSWTGDEGLVAPFSNYGQEEIDIFSPGMAIYSSAPENEYRYADGTSMASPVVAGVAAVLRSYFPSLNAEQVKQIIIESAKSTDLEVYKPGTDELVPFNSLSASGGMVNLYNAVLKAAQTKGKNKIKEEKDKA